MNELEKDRLPVLKARERNRAKGRKLVKKTEDSCNKELRRLNIAIQSGLTSRKELKDAEKITLEKVLS